jgi:hypothetical protein
VICWKSRRTEGRDEQERNESMKNKQRKKDGLRDREM